MEPHSMRLLPTALAVLAATAGLRAQFSQNPLRFWDQSTEYTSRGLLKTAPGHLSQALTAGQVSGLRRLTRISYVVQDQTGLVPKSWNVQLAGLDARGLPNYAAATTLVGPLTMPPSRGIQAWLVTHNFNSNTSVPIPVPASSDQIHVCWQLLPAPVNDLSLHMSYDPGTIQSPCSGNESPRVEARTPTAEQLGWSAAPPGVPAPYQCSWRLDLAFDEPTVQGAALPYAQSNCKANTGYAALDPDFADLGPSTPARFDDYTWTISGGSAFAGGTAILFHSQTVLGVPLTIPRITGQFWLDPTDPLFAIPAVVPLNATGSGVFQLGLVRASASVRAVAGAIPSWSSQALLLAKNGTAQLSQLWTMRPRLAPPGFRAGTATSITPWRIPKPAAMRSFTLRNDGRGTLTIVLLAGTGRIAQTTVIERTMQTIAVPASVTVIQVNGAKTLATQFYYR